MKSDDSGFLIPDSGVKVEALTRGIHGVRADTSAILSILKTGARSQTQARSRATNSSRGEVMGRPLDGSREVARAAIAQENAAEAVKSVARVLAAQSRERGADGRFLSAQTAELSKVAKAVDTMTRQQATQHAEKKRDTAAAASKSADQSRDTSGRFVGKGGAKASAGASEDDTGGVNGRARREREQGEGFDFMGKLKGLFSGAKMPTLSTGDLEKVDPTIEAGKELGKLVSGPAGVAGAVGKAVVGRGFAAASKLPAAPWYRRIIGELRGSRKENAAYALSEDRVLHEIERKTGGGAHGEKGGILGSIGGLFSKGLGGLGGLLGKGGGGLMSLLGGGLKLGGGLLKRLPILGALFAGGSALASIFGGDDPNKTPEENKTSRFEGAGSGIGALLGGAIGSLVGPLGTIAGGMIGDKVGELVGKWLSTLDWADIGKTISDAWDTAVGTVTDTWKVVTDKLGDVVKTVSDVWNGIITGVKGFIKDKFGIDVDAVMKKAHDAIAPVVEPVKAAVAATVDKAKEVGGAAVGYVGDRVEKMAAPIKTAAANATDWAKGLVGGGSKGTKEAVMRQAATIADPKERAMFLAQTDHESGGFRTTEENLNYSAKGLRKTFGKYYKTDAEAAADAKNPEAIANKVYGGRMGNTDPGDGYKYRGRGVIQLTGKDNYAAAGKALGLDLVNNPDLLQDPDISARVAKWYWDSKKGLGDAARAGDVTAATKKINGGTIGLADRQSKYASYLAANPSVGAPVPPSVATVPSIAVASASAPPAPVAQIPQKMSSDGPVEVRVAKDQAAGQDLADRPLASIATGGLSAG